MRTVFTTGIKVLGILLAALLVAGSLNWKTAKADSAVLGALATAPRAARVPSDVFVHVPPNVASTQPLRVLLVLHGMGGQGKAFAQPLVDAANRNRWVLVAPTMPYVVDYNDPSQLVQEDLGLGVYLQTLLEELPAQLGLRLDHQVMIVGFSRGAQVAHRFAFMHPEHVASVAAISAGSYTMPFIGRDGKVLKFPFGVGDLQQRLGAPVDWGDFKDISFWIAVGAKDNRPGDVARAFDPYCGATRVERARTFRAALRDMGINAQLQIFANADHEVTSEIWDSAVQFLRNDELADSRVDSAVPLFVHPRDIPF